MRGRLTPDQARHHQSLLLNLGVEAVEPDLPRRAAALALGLQFGIAYCDALYQNRARRRYGG